MVTAECAARRASSGPTALALAQRPSSCARRPSTPSSRVLRAAPESPAAPATAVSARATVEAYYAAYNRGDLDAVIGHFAEDCVYYDAIYLEPFYGQAAVAEYFLKFRGMKNLDQLKFVVTDYAGNGNSVGVVWHTEMDDALFPFSRGCSFYTVNAEGKIIWGRDCAEASPPKPGDSTLGALKVLIPLMRTIGVKNADPANLTVVPFAAAAAWAFYAVYMGWIMFSSAAPGLPAWQVTGDTLAQVLHESLNFFYINIGLDRLGLAPVPSIAEHPVSEALFNFVNAWGLMFLPVLLADQRCRKVQALVPQWVAVMALTNVFFIPLLAQRAAPEPHPSGLAPHERTHASLSAAAAQQYSGQIAGADAARRGGAGVEGPRGAAWARGVGGVGMFIGGLSMVWALAARPEYGDLASRWQYFVQQAGGERVFYAFVVDAGLYGFWQALLMRDAGAARRFCAVPFFGQAAWLLAGMPKEADEKSGST